MGTVGGKTGLAVGVVVAFVVSVDMIRLILGSCFFEGGCSNEGVGLVAVATACLAVALGLTVRLAVNRLLRANR